MEDNKIYVAVGDTYELDKVMKRAIKISNGETICVFRINETISPIGEVGGEESMTVILHISENGEPEVLEELDYCLQICKRKKVPCEKLYFEKESVAEGIVELIHERKIKKLVIGTEATDASLRRYVPKPKSNIGGSPSNVEPTPPECRESVTQPSSDVEETPSNALENDGPDEGSSAEFQQSGISFSPSSTQLPEAESAFSSPRSSFARVEVKNKDQELSPAKLMEQICMVELYEQLEQESTRRQKAEEEARIATRKVKDIQRFCIGELRQMKEKHEESKKEHEFTKTLLEKVLQEFHKTLNQKLTLENQYEKTYLSEKELEENLLLAVDLSQKYKNYGEQMEEEKNHALKEAQELRNQLDHETSMSQVPILEFLFLDLDKATNFFDATMKIGEGGKGTTYKGVLHHTNVAITMLNPNTISGPQEFKQEVNVLSRLRHPNIVTLIGMCSEPQALVYEYLSRGSLEDRLICKDNTLPLTWKTRIQIATQLCYVLTFLHSSCPSSIIHGNLKPSNILLDDNFTCKLHDFGTCSIIPNDTEKTSSFITNFQKRREKRFNNTELDTFTYMDPNCLAAEELTPKADVYSFGIILLRLITGKPAFGLAKEMKCVLDKGDLNDILDPLVRDRPYVQAEQLARLALRCCDMDPMSRPDIFEIWKVLESMKASSQSLRHLLDSEDHVPAYFICPITQDIMEDPHIAADGFTYERQSIKEWLGSGHCTSPMTLVKLANKNLVPNHALRSGIKEWLQHRHSA